MKKTYYQIDVPKISWKYLNSKPKTTTENKLFKIGLFIWMLLVCIVVFYLKNNYKTFLREDVVVELALYLFLLSAVFTSIPYKYLLYPIYKVILKKEKKRHREYYFRKRNILKRFKKDNKKNDNSLFYLSITDTIKNLEEKYE